MLNFPARLFAAAFVIGLAFTPTLTHAEEDATVKSGNSSESDGASATETFMEKLEDAFKETTTPTEKEVDPIGTAEDTDRDLY